VLVSLTNVLTGRVSDPVVGRDVLIGVAFGVSFALILRSIEFWTSGGSPLPGDFQLLLGWRQAVGEAIERAVYAARNTLLYFFLLFVLRALLRKQWAAAAAFTAFWTMFVALGNERAWEGALVGFLFFGTAAFVVLRWGLLSFAVGLYMLTMLQDLPVTLDGSAWYFGNTMLLVAIVIALAVWSFYTSVGGRMWKAQPLGHEIRRDPVAPT
jgi:hypothetical protein